MAGQGGIFGCQDAEDSIEHYSCCPAVAEFGRSRLGMQAAMVAPPEERLPTFLLVDREPQQWRPSYLILGALRTAAVYKVHNWWRHAVRRSPTMAKQALHQSVRDYVSGHARARRALDAAGVPGAQ